MVVASSEVVLGYTVAVATVTLHSLLEVAVDERHDHNPQAEVVIVGAFDLDAGCTRDCSCVVTVHCAAGTTVGQHELLVRVFDREVYVNAVQFVVEASAVDDS